MEITKSNNKYKAEFETDNTKAFAKKIENSGCVKQKFQGNQVIRYLVEFDKYPIEIRVLSKKVVFLSGSRAVIEAFVESL